jgi:hypothetical protein
MEAELSLSPSQALLGYAVICAIPVVLMALWAEYFSQHLERQKQTDPEFDRELELDQVKFVGILGLVGQVILFLMHSDLHDQAPFLAPGIFLLSILAQLHIQSGAETQVSQSQPAVKNGLASPDPSSGSQSPSQSGESNPEGGSLGVSLRGAACWLFGVLLHLVFLAVFAFASGGLIQAVQPSFWKGLGILGASGVLGLSAGVATNLLLAPIYLRFIFQARPLEAGVLRSQFEKNFDQFGVPQPEFWWMDLPDLKVTRNVLVGWRRAPGIFRQGFFVSQWVVEHLSPSELEAITLNQLSPFALGHARKRSALIFTLIVGTTVLALGALVSGQVFHWGDVLSEFGAAVLSVVLFLGAFRVLGAQSEKQEAESDRYCVEQMGVRLEVLVRALRKLDFLAAAPVLPRSGDWNQVTSLPLGFPETERRIRALQKSLGDQKEPSQQNRAA